METSYAKSFENNGEIREGQVIDGKFDGFKWILKEDGTHDKFSVQRVKKDIKDSDKDPHDNSGTENEESDDDPDEDQYEEVLTFICNEKV
jgi:hypothetical protein